MIKIKKIIIPAIIGIIIIGTLIINSLPKAIQQTLTTPIIPSDNTLFPSKTTISAIPQPRLQIDWSQTSITDKDNQYPIFNSKPLLSDDVANQIAQNLKFQTTDKKTLEQNNQIWKTKEQILLYTPKEETIAYQNLIKPQSGKPFQDSQVKDIAEKISQQILPNHTFRVASIVYLKDNYYSNPTAIEYGEIAQVYLDQIINNYPVIPSNLSQPHTMLIYLYKDLSIKTINLSNGYSEAAVGLNFQKFNFDKLKTTPIDSFVKLTPLKLDKQGIFDTGSQVLFTAQKVEPAYINIKNSLSPVYLITGNIKIDNLTPFPDTVMYAAPMN